MIEVAFVVGGEGGIFYLVECVAWDTTGGCW